MSSPDSPRIIVVLGATGNQGAGVVRAVLESKTPDGGLWHVRGLTRDPNSEKAKKFVADNQTSDHRLSLVRGDAYNGSSLQDAFAGAYGVFAMTSETQAGRVLEQEEDLKHEIEAGRQMVRAAKACGVKHFIFSSLPDMVSVTGGRYPNIYHMNNKHEIEKFAREQLSAVTCLIPADGVVRFHIPIPSSQVAQWTDPVYDMGIFAAKVLESGIEKTRGKTYLVLSSRVTPAEMVETFTKVTGQRAIHDPISAEEFGERTAPFVGPAFKRDATEMMEWAAILPADKICYGAYAEDEDHSFEELGLKASSFEEWLHRSGWTGPA
ncbi:putative cinnamoyl-CoA reductase [Aspergillus saccharolyticus JOP 1030-1]|uniref:Putative cinnamoyl-CoA reductase n=1 Tax=Aspergillus saccharolyticus JOP 1030-1 TaxID=1450539 RepID=A0A319AQM9_9EURO|nr:putative cinnamoyl-CoA reductase [Aspergillus saccharolyticus JOP 1030-1]PYH48702.1 putative cinnamoyl-CoA reductase [Aspergillus saccharolyticus JOP 1030-1]